MRKVKITAIYVVSLIIYYLVLNNINLFDSMQMDILFVANSTYNIEYNTLVISMFIIFTAINLVILSYQFNAIDEIINMRNYIAVRTKKISNILYKEILKNSIMFIVIKIIIDLTITKGTHIKDIAIININILLSLLIYCLLYLALSLKGITRRNSLMIIVFFNLVGALTYYKTNILRLFVYLPGKSYLDASNSIISKLIFLIVLFILTIHYEKSNK